MYEADGECRKLYPSEARLRSLTYCAPVYVDAKWEKVTLDRFKKPDPNIPVEVSSYADNNKVLLGYLPIMLRSKFCNLSDLSDFDLQSKGECIFDQGGYFVVNGSEKVIIAQERMSNNHVYVFRKQQPSKFEWVSIYYYHCLHALHDY